MGIYTGVTRGDEFDVEATNFPATMVVRTYVDGSFFQGGGSVPLWSAVSWICSPLEYLSVDLFSFRAHTQVVDKVTSLCDFRLRIV